MKKASRRPNTRRAEPDLRGRRNTGRAESRRRQLAYESARIISQDGVIEFERAKRKAAERTGIVDRRCWPRNDEIQEALTVQRHLFERDAQDTELRELRQHAFEAMRMFAAFEPRLVGQLLSDTVVKWRGVRLHLHAENPEDVVLELLNRQIPWTQRESVLRYPDGDQRSHPTLSFVAGDTSIELIVLPVHARRRPPLSALTERPERGLDLQGVRELLESDN
jgi:hypothetical protein